jgi:transcriptional regulator with XRE-family HTH domain
MAAQSFGDAVRQLRIKTGLSLREFAEKANISPPFLSDIELGKRYPSDETLEKLAKLLKVSVEHLKKYDHRDSASDLKRLIESDPRIGLAFRNTVQGLKNGKVTTEDLLRMLGQQKKGRA